jgi:hypothetical protein
VAVAKEETDSVGVAATVKVVPVAVVAKARGASVTVVEAGWALVLPAVADQTVADHSRPLLASVGRQPSGSHQLNLLRHLQRSTWPASTASAFALQQSGERLHPGWCVHPVHSRAYRSS